MPEIPNVVPSTTIEVEWGNAIRDRTLQRYDDVSTRTAESPSPDDGDLSFLENSGEIAVFYSGAWRSIVPTGAVLPFAGPSAPGGFLLCNGAAVSRTTYAALWNAISSTFGPGDGSTTFNLPDLRQRFPLGVAASGTGNDLGETGGAIDHTHTGPSHTHTGPSHTHAIGTHGTTSDSHNHTNNHTHAGPSHTHSFSDTSSGGATGESAPEGIGVSTSPAGHTHSVSGTSGAGGTGDTGNASSATGSDSHSHSVTIAATAAGGTGATGAAGTGATGSNNPPFLALHYIIKT
jgi:microcystin-dependent protein